MKCLSFLLFLCFGLEISGNLVVKIHGIALNELKENGTNVCFDTATTYKKVEVSYSDQTVRTVYYTKCYWGHWHCSTLSRQQVVSVTKWREEWREVEQKIFRCCNGWTKKVDDAQVCLQPICQVHCRNGGECIAPDTCKCKRGYEGQYCQLLVDDCAAKRPPVCDQTCTLTISAHKCSCRQGWKLLDDKKSCKAICGVHCLNGGECIGPDTCKCKDGFEGRYCQLLVDDCAAKRPPVCDQTCTTTTSGHKCSCRQGWQLLDDKKSCKAICAVGCRNGGECIAPETCKCKDGFEGQYCQFATKPSVRNKVVSSQW